MQFNLDEIKSILQITDNSQDSKILEYQELLEGEICRICNNDFLKFFIASVNQTGIDTITFYHQNFYLQQYAEFQMLIFEQNTNRRIGYVTSKRNRNCTSYCLNAKLENTPSNLSEFLLGMPKSFLIPLSKGIKFLMDNESASGEELNQEVASKSIGVLSVSYRNNSGNTGSSKVESFMPDWFVGSFKKWL